MADELRAACELCGDTGRLDLSSRCHPTAPLRAVIDNGRLTLRCYVPECDRVVADWPAGLLLPPADDGAAVEQDWLQAVGMADQWYDDTWGTPLHSSSPIGIAVQTNGRAMVRLGTTVSYLGDVVLPTRGHVRRLALALGISLPAAATDGPTPRGES
jgi:hypothetical protein